MIFIHLFIHRWSCALVYNPFQGKIKLNNPILNYQYNLECCLIFNSIIIGLNSFLFFLFSFHVLVPIKNYSILVADVVVSVLTKVPFFYI